MCSRGLWGKRKEVEKEEGKRAGENQREREKEDGRGKKNDFFFAPLKNDPLVGRRLKG